MIIKVKYLTEIEPIEINDKGDWIDLRSAQTMELKKGEFYLIPLGVAMELPPHYEAHVVPRSSTFKRWGIIQTNSMGIIDSSYCGDTDEWKMPVYATRDTTIYKGDRVCQFRIDTSMFMTPVEIVKVDSLNNNNRGGFGTTGVK